MTAMSNKPNPPKSMTPEQIHQLRRDVLMRFGSIPIRMMMDAEPHAVPMVGVIAFPALDDDDEVALRLVNAMRVGAQTPHGGYWESDGKLAPPGLHFGYVMRDWLLDAMIDAAPHVYEELHRAEREGVKGHSVIVTWAGGTLCGTGLDVGEGELQ